MGLKFTNNASATLSGAITNVQTSISLTAGQGALFPTLAAGDYFYGTLISASGTIEIVLVTARSTDTLTVVRGQDGTTGTAFSGGDRFELRLPRAQIQATQQEAVATLGATGTDTYAANLAPAPQGYNTNQLYFIQFANANTSTAPTINLNSLGAKTIKKMRQGSKVALVPGDLGGRSQTLWFDGTDMVVLDPRGGKVTVWVPAGSLVAQSGAAPTQGQVAFATSLINAIYQSFDPATAQYAHWAMKMPKGWNQGTFTFRPVWYQDAAGTGNVVWGVDMLAVRDTDSLTQARGTAQTMTVAGGTTNVQYEPTDSAAITPGGTIGSECVVHARIYRDAANVADTLTVAAKLLGVYVSYQVNELTDD